MPPNGIRIGLPGAGRIGRIHGANIVAMEGAVLAAIFDPLEGAARALGEGTGAPVRALDSFYVRGDIETTQLERPRGPKARTASDHLPLVARLRLMPIRR